MKSSVETLEGNKVKVYVEVAEDEFDKDIDRAFQAIAREVRLPGFRNGKAPRRVLEARIGVAPAREQALRDSIPVYLARAVREHHVDLIAPPEIEITDGTDDGPVEFDATCEVRPEVDVPGYGGLRVELPSPFATDADIDEAIDAERRRHGSLTDAGRPIERGDFVTLDLTTTRDGEPLSGLNAEDFSYEVGQGWITDDFDDQLAGAIAGDELTFTSTPKGTDEPADFTVTVGAVQRLELPDVDDEWVSENLGEHETVEEWREALTERISEQKLEAARNEYVGAVTGALVQLVDADAPDAMVQNEFSARLKNTVDQLQARGVEIGQFLSATGQDPDAFTASVREQSVQAVKLDLALRAVAAAEGFEVTDDELDAEFAAIGTRFGEKTAKVRKAYERNDGVADLVANIRKSRALDHLLHHTDVVGPDGAPIDRDLILGHTHDEHTPDGVTPEHAPDDATPEDATPEDATPQEDGT